MARRSQAWKQLERDAAEAFGGHRNPASAGLGGPDAESPAVVVECKHRATSSHGTLYREARAHQARRLEGRLFVLVTRDRGHEALATVKLEELAALVRAADSD